MNSPRWMWTAKEAPEVAELLKSSPEGLDWCSKVYRAVDAVTGKILGVCAAASVAREYLKEPGSSRVMPADAASLSILDAWIDDPNDDRFEHLCAAIFGKDGDAASVADLSHAVWWALRTATTHIDGVGEMEWALESLRDGMIKDGFSPERLCWAALSGVRERLVEERLAT